MKFKFKIQSFQTQVVNDVIACFEGQIKNKETYNLGSGPNRKFEGFEKGFRNSELKLTDSEILENIKKVQRRQNLPLSQKLDDFTIMNSKGERKPVQPSYKKQAAEACKVHLDIEMETGTGKTYCYIKTIFEMHKLYGWSKFIIMVPSIAIREGVFKSFQITADHFTENYGRKARFFIYNSKSLHELENFSSDAGINVMVINIQAFNARGKENRRIYEKLDNFQTRKPIDVIAGTRPILILDEPQKMEGKATMGALPKFTPLFILRYSATHRTLHNCV
ncbi:restriction endonuclease subunit R, partial [Candidatus Saccharibacteria bacterium]|nr:restriction endonuclease subunit R [Candidatus Saccharibacteria bacterium]